MAALRCRTCRAMRWRGRPLVWRRLPSSKPVAGAPMPAALAGPGFSVPRFPLGELLGVVLILPQREHLLGPAPARHSQPHRRIHHETKRARLCRDGSFGARFDSPRQNSLNQGNRVSLFEKILLFSTQATGCGVVDGVGIDRAKLSSTPRPRASSEARRRSSREDSRN